MSDLPQPLIATSVNAVAVNAREHRAVFSPRSCETLTGGILSSFKPFLHSPCSDGPKRDLT
jgi:hypothetical protein